MRDAISAPEAYLAAERPDHEPLFEDAAADWLRYLENVDGAKPSTLSDYRYMLGAADAPVRNAGE